MAQTKLDVFPLLKDVDGFTGMCQYRYKEGMFHGDYRDGLRHGRGTFMFSDGDSYIGSWLDDVYWGYGEYKCADGIFEGNHVEGLWQGEGRYTWPNGDVYVGRFKENAFHGPGEKTYKKSKPQGCEWRPGAMNSPPPRGKNPPWPHHGGKSPLPVLGW